ncbi:hypothetical protein F4801DRAFT_576812 [Xylaria longipes]|nr:hypothetical protein F4801DRAFT_576812 [Xylaria longipes]
MAEFSMPNSCEPSKSQSHSKRPEFSCRVRLSPQNYLRLTFQYIDLTNLGPLTTTYTAIVGIPCLFMDLATDPEGFWLERANKFEDCFPPNFTPLNGYCYSPGICQDGYTYACATAVGGSGTTATTCCTRYVGQGQRAGIEGSRQDDFQYMGEGQWLHFRSTLSGDDNNACQSILRSDSSYIGDVIAYPDGLSTVIGTTTTLISAGEIVYAIGVPVRRAAHDAEWSIPSTNIETTATQMQTPEQTPKVRPKV